ncbi:hypothetical protein [Mechercharimyces sp. CAU 1602]|uniref:hypothetical protein n=1 Tax=Mechercharimyces sp. CAU 1602 TaxID=2973933 RepID=UPI0021619ADA|nr:hypothetical protein [Mechercharimyces sp. CAU 1602]MCS1351466.1 hypothetical protein [Mechercharimyces sp. CAU 1602]
MRTKVLGIVLIFAGFMFFSYQEQWELFQGWLSWELIVLLSGIMIIAISLRSPYRKMMLHGAIVTAIGLQLWGESHLHYWPNHWSNYVVILGSAIFIVGILQKMKFYIGSGIAALAFGFIWWPLAPSFSLIAKIRYVFLEYWPLALIAIGIFLLWRKK